MPGIRQTHIEVNISVSVQGIKNHMQNYLVKTIVSSVSSCQKLAAFDRFSERLVFSPTVFRLQWVRSNAAQAFSVRFYDFNPF